MSFDNDALPTAPEVTGVPGAPGRAVWTVPNIISMVRILLIVVFGVALISAHDGIAIGALIAAGVSDFLDGFLARRWDQVTQLGGILDPAADRLLTLVVVIGLAVRGVIPWWLVIVLLARDVVVGAAMLAARRRSVGLSHVTLVGKAATFGLYVFLPLTYLAFLADAVVLWRVGVGGTALVAILYWWSGLGYFTDMRDRIRNRRRAVK